MGLMVCFVWVLDEGEGEGGVVGVLEEGRMGG